MPVSARMRKVWPIALAVIAAALVGLASGRKQHACYKAEERQH